MDKKVVILLRLGLGFSFIYPGVSMLVGPNIWLGWFPSLIIENLPGAIPVLYLVYATGILDILIGSLLTLGILLRYITVLGIIHLVGVVALGPAGSLIITFRDIGLIFSLAALYLLTKRS